MYLVTIFLLLRATPLEKMIMLILIVAVIVAVFAFLFGNKESEKDEEKDKKQSINNRIKDENVTVNNVLLALSSFKPQIEARLKTKYTEKSLQKQLKVHLQSKFVHVNYEQGIDSIHINKIAFDIAHGKVGVELKLARNVFEKNFDQLIGQIENLTKAKYNENNLIILIIGENNHTNNTAKYDVVQEMIKSKNSHFCYLEILSA